jgi:hypothetical protein
VNLETIRFYGCPVALEGTILADDFQNSIFHVGICLRRVDKTTFVAVGFEDAQSEAYGRPGKRISLHQSTGFG